MSEKACFHHLKRIIVLIAISAAVFIYAESGTLGIMQQGNLEDGIYEDDGHFFVVKDDAVSAEVLKSFYGFWYDGFYDVEDGDQVYLAQIEDGLYLEWWNREDIPENAVSGGVFWAPGSNVREIAITPYPVKERLSGWFIVPRNEGQSPAVYEIPYWKADIEYSEDLASFKLPDGTDAYVCKHVKIGDVVYTCAAGHRKVVRNPALKESLPGTPLFSEGGVIMVLNEPYLVKSDITDLKTEIEMHNAILYPPRFSTMDMKEPSIYKKLEDMPIEW